MVYMGNYRKISDVLHINDKMNAFQILTKGLYRI